MLQNFGTALGREEMKMIKGGGNKDGGEGLVCHVGMSCSVYDKGITYHGTCDAGFGGGSGGWMPCGCSTDLGPYNVGSNSGVSRCAS